MISVLAERAILINKRFQQIYPRREELYDKEAVLGEILYAGALLIRAVLRHFQPLPALDTAKPICAKCEKYPTFNEIIRLQICIET